VRSLLMVVAYVVVIAYKYVAVIAYVPS